MVSSQKKFTPDFFQICKQIFYESLLIFFYLWPFWGTREAVWWALINSENWSGMETGLWVFLGRWYYPCAFYSDEMALCSEQSYLESLSWANHMWPTPDHLRNWGKEHQVLEFWIQLLWRHGFLFSLSPDPIPNSLMRPGDLFLNPTSVSSCPLPLPRGAMGSSGSQPQHCQGREVGIPVHYTMFSNILGFYPLDASSPLLLAVMIKTVCRHGCLSPEGQNYPQEILRTTGVDKNPATREEGKP